MCNSCNSCGCGGSLFGGLANAVNNLFGSGCGCGCGQNGNNGCGCGCGQSGNNGCGCGASAAAATGLSAYTACGEYDCYYARQYALYPFNTAGSGICSCCQ